MYNRETIKENKRKNVNKTICPLCGIECKDEDHPLRCKKLEA